MLSSLTQRFKKKSTFNYFPQIDPEKWQGLEASATEPREVPLNPTFKPHFEQPRNDLSGFFSALREAAERFDMTHIAPLAAFDKTVRFQLRTITVQVKPENDKLLRELQALQPQIIKTAAISCLRQSQSEERFDLREFFGIGVVAGDEVAAGEAVMTLATIGIERINLDFEFAGEHISFSPPETPVATPSQLRDITLRLRHPDGREENLAVAGFPLLLGTAPTADIRVQGKYVSREHATLYFDTAMNRLMLQDHSSHGTWLNGKHIGPEGRGLLHGKGQICLSSPQNPDAPIIEFSHTAVEHLQTTPLVGEEEIPPARLVTPIPADTAAHVPAININPLTRETALTPNGDIQPSTRTDIDAHVGAAETQLTCDVAPQALAYLQIRSLEGIKTLPITEVPFVIGREPKGTGFAVDAKAGCVSREHLKLVSYQHKQFAVENGGLGRNNTFLKGALQDSRFLYQTVHPNSDIGWIVLGGHRLDDKCVEIRLLSECPEGLR